MTAPSATLVYVGDPMCSWCWGFAPVIDDISARAELPVEVVVGGLRPGPAAEPISGRLGHFLAREWSTIAERTGQPFDAGILEELGEDWIYDTELPAMAVVEMRREAPSRTLDFFVRLQRAFYAERIDVTDLRLYPDLLKGFEVDGEGFVDRLAGEEPKKETWQDFAQARRWGINGFPTLILRRQDRLHLVTAGYRPAQEIDDILRALGM